MLLHHSGCELTESGDECGHRLRAFRVVRSELLVGQLLHDLFSKLRVIVLFGQNVEELRHRFRQMLEVGQVLHHARLSAVSVSVVLDGHTQDFEDVHANGGVPHSGFALKQEVHRPCEHADECVPLACCHKDLSQLELHDLRHGLHCNLQLTRRIPTAIFLRRLALWALLCTSRRCRFLRALRLYCRNAPLKKEGKGLQDLLVMRRLCLTVLLFMVNGLRFGTKTRDDQFEQLAKGCRGDE